MIVVKRPHHEVQPEAVLVEVLHHEDVLGREVVVGREVRIPVARQAVDARVDDPVRRVDRVLPPRRAARQARRGHVAREHLGVQVHAGEDRVRGPLGEAPVHVGGPAQRQRAAHAVEFRLDEVEHGGARVPRPGHDLRIGHDRHAAEHVQQHVVVERPQGPKLGLEDVLVGHGDVLERLQHDVRLCDAGEEDVPHAVDVVETRRAVRGPRLLVDLEPATVVEPVADRASARPSRPS